jgi:hypothetical protein
MVVSTTEQDPLPLGTEARLADFTELLATAIENAESREALARLAEEQAMLRRMATLVAQGVRPDEVFSAVSEEVGRIFGSDTAAVVRFEHDPPALVVVGARQSIPASPIGTRWELDDGLASTEVYRTGRSARVDAMDWSSLSGPVAESARRLGVVSSVACPIIVEGRLWGTLSVSAKAPMPLDAEERLEKFSQLVATAIANADSRSELAASRRRIVAASDEARRRIERDLHDGTQQRLVSLGLAVRAAEADVPPDRATFKASCPASPRDWPMRSRSCRSSRVGSTPRSFPGVVSARRCERSRAALRSRSSSTSRRTRGSLSRSRSPHTTSPRRPWRMRRSMPRPRASTFPWQRATAACSYRSATTASAGPTRRAAPGWSASPTASRRWAGRPCPQSAGDGTQITAELPLEPEPVGEL